MVDGVRTFSMAQPRSIGPTPLFSMAQPRSIIGRGRIEGSCVRVGSLAAAWPLVGALVFMCFRGFWKALSMTQPRSIMVLLCAGVAVGDHFVW